MLPEIFAGTGLLVSKSCHSINDVELMRGADFILLAPIFKPLSKTDTRPVLGTEAIEQFTRLSPIPVLALGGINAANARRCVEAGAAGVAGISYFNGLPNRSVRASLLL